MSDIGARATLEVDPKKRNSNSFSVDASYLLDVVGENDRDLLWEGPSNSLLSAESQDNSQDYNSEPLKALTQIEGLGPEERTKALTQIGQVGPEERKKYMPQSPPLQSQKPIKGGNKNGAPRGGQLLSPFSPLLHPYNGRTESNRSSEGVSWALPASFSDSDLSLYPCRKVSVVIHVSYHSTGEGRSTHSSEPHMDSANNSEFSQNAIKTQRLCLFPLVHDRAITEGNHVSRTQEQETLSPTSATLRSSSNCRELVLVNPKSFGKFIPSEITMETARLVAQVANIESEDWARSYSFQHVIWPDQEVSSLCHLAQAMANDVLSGMDPKRDTVNLGHHKDGKSSPSEQHINIHRIIIGTGSSHDRTHMLFGRPNRITTYTNGRTTESKANSSAMSAREMLDRYGIVGAAFDTILKDLPNFAVCSLSAYEILGEDEVCDLLALPSTTCSKNKTQGRKPQIRQSQDRKGAIVQGLTEYPLDSLQSLRDCLLPLSQSSPSDSQKKSRIAKACKGGHIIVILKIWRSALQHELDLQSKCATLTFVDLAPSHTPLHQTHQQYCEGDISHFAATGELAGATSPSNASHTPYIFKQSRVRQSPKHLSMRQTNFLRNSVSSLGSVLRGNLLREAGSDTVIPYRSSILTKVLQRQLDHPESRAVVLASVSPLSDAYDGTLATLRYVDRLLIRSGLPKSPFEKQQVRSPRHNISPQSMPSSPSDSILSSTATQPRILMEQFAGKEYILESIVTDPRQRLAKFYKSRQEESPTDSSSGSMDLHTVKAEESDNDRLATGYMQVDPGSIHVNSQISSSLKDEDERQGGVGDGVRDTQVQEETRKTTSYSSPLAKYIIPPLSPAVTKDSSNDNNAGSSKKNHLDDQDGVVPHSRTKGSFLAVPSAAAEFNETGEGEPEKSPQCSKTSFAQNRQLDGNNQSSPVVAVDPDRTSYRTFSDSTFYQGISNLESSIETMKNIDFDVWKASSVSIQQLKDRQAIQEKLAKDVIVERNAVIENAKQSHERVLELSKQMNIMRMENDSQIATLNDVIDAARADRADVEKIAEEAIAAQDSLEQTVSELENKLLANRNSSRVAHEELKRVTESKEIISKELKEVKDKLFAVEEEFRQAQTTSSKMQLKVKSLEEEKRHMAITLSEYEQVVNQLKDDVIRTNHTQKDTVAALRAEISQFTSEKDALLAEKATRESELLEELKKAGQAVEHCKQDLKYAEERTWHVREQERLGSATKDQEIAALRRKISLLNGNLKDAEKERDDAIEYRDSHQENYKQLSEELEKMQNVLDQRISDVEELSLSLEQALAEKEELHGEIAQKERHLANFQMETKQRVGRVLKYRDDASLLLENTMEENRALVDTNRKLQEALRQMTVERDDATRSRLSRAVEAGALDYGKNESRRQGSQRGLDAPMGERGNPKQTVRTFQHDVETNKYQHHGSEGHQNTFRPNHDSLHPVPDLLRQVPRHSRQMQSDGHDFAGLTVRAEEIAACLALSARKSMVRGFETGDEEDKELLIAALKRKVKLLERALVFGENTDHITH